VRFDAAEHSDEVGETPASDSQRAAVSHLGRACVEAYHGEDECGGALGAENGSLVWPAVSGGALRRWRCGVVAAAAALASGGRRGERSGGDRVEPGAAGRRPDQVKAGRPRRVHDADVRPPRGRRRVVEGRRPRAGERGGENGPRCLAGPKGRRVGPAAPAPFSFFFNFFSPKSLNKTFEAFTNPFRGWSKKKNCSPQNSLQLCFNKQSQILNRI